MVLYFREAELKDIPQMQVVRHLVKENTLSDPQLVTNEDCATYIKQSGKGWVCEADYDIVGFAIADLKDNNIWALFVNPAYEGRGIGSYLHQTMLNWYFENNKTFVWLGTAPGTRAEAFYRMKGWRETGTNGANKVRFEMTKEEWLNIRRL